MFDYHAHTFRVLSGIHNIFLQLGKFFMRFNMMTHSDTSEHFKGSISKPSRIFESNIGRASNPQLTSATFGFQAVTLLNLSAQIQCRASPSNYDCRRAAFIFDGIPFQNQREPLSEPDTKVYAISRLLLLSISHSCSSRRCYLSVKYFC